MLVSRIVNFNKRYIIDYVLPPTHMPIACIYLNLFWDFLFLWNIKAIKRQEANKCTLAVAATWAASPSGQLMEFLGVLVCGMRQWQLPGLCQPNFPRPFFAPLQLPGLFAISFPYAQSKYRFGGRLSCDFCERILIQAASFVVVGFGCLGSRIGFQFWRIAGSGGRLVRGVVASWQPTTHCSVTRVKCYVLAGRRGDQDIWS